MDTQQEQQIIIKGEEVLQFNEILDTIPHREAKKLVRFINSCQQKRVNETKLAEVASQLAHFQMSKYEGAKTADKSRLTQSEGEQVQLGTKALTKSKLTLEEPK